MNARRPSGAFAPAWIWPFVAVAGVAVTIFPRLRWISIYEDQAALSGLAMQMAAGQVPYRDFDTSIAPGSIFMYGLYYKLVGASVLNQRLITGVAMLMAVWLVAHIGRRVLPGWWAAAVALLWGVWLPVFQEFQLRTDRFPARRKTLAESGGPKKAHVECS